MLHIAICDDQANYIKKICSLVEYYTTKQNIEVDIREFNDPLVFLEGLNRSRAADILILDICMPGVLGTEVDKEIRRRRDKTEIIFITSSHEFAVDALAIKATHILLNRICSLYIKRFLPSSSRGVFVCWEHKEECQQATLCLVRHLVKNYDRLRKIFLKFMKK